MNRKNRRAAAKRGEALAAGARRSGEPETAALMAEARDLYQQGRAAEARLIGERIVAREPAHVEALNLLGVIAQQSGRPRLAVKFFTQGIAADPRHGGCHYNLASCYQALDRRDEAVAHFRQAIVIGMTARDVQERVSQNPVVGACLARITQSWPVPVGNEELFGADRLAAIAKDAFLQCAMETISLTGWAIEAFLTGLRSTLLQLAETSARASPTVGDGIVDVVCALAQQCFINEYVFAQRDEEVRLASQWRDRLSEGTTAGGEVAPLMLAAVGAYFPLHSLAMAEQLLQGDWPPSVARLLRQQIGEPLEEARDRESIPRLTAIDDGVSLHVRQQYEENPYPRWTLSPFKRGEGEGKMPSAPAGGSGQRVKDILVAGCGTGEHPIEIARAFPDAQVLAVDLSLTSLAYARRKTCEEGLRNIEYAQADILKLAAVGRSFDHIEAIGVLHHLADPAEGWRVLLSLLRPEGEMRIALYSEIARRAVVEARALIAERGFRATAEDIRQCRQALLRGGFGERFADVTGTSDFYSMSGCRDLLFNVMEHRFTIPEIKAFLRDQRLSFLGFEVEPEVSDKFQRQFQDAGALYNLDCWHAFETANPATFLKMYRFSVRKDVQH
jgi:2-polyprenyl-3-methyl-5-hydroxy-6-metoxy-1,4-benzoquinol methylase